MKTDTQSTLMEHRQVVVGANSKDRNVCKVITFKTGWTLVWRGQPYTSKKISKDTEAKVPVIHFIGLV